MNPWWYGARPDFLLKFEGLILLIAVGTIYEHFYPGRWGLFALLFLAPDVALVPFVWSKGQGAVTFYNVMHSYVLPLGLGLFAWFQSSALAGEIGLIWMAHISFDRLIGYGLKYPGEFKRTHIQSSAHA